jgi:hypothetical protein
MNKKYIETTLPQYLVVECTRPKKIYLPPVATVLLNGGGGGQFSTAHLDIYGGVSEYGHAHPCRGLPSAQYSINITNALQRQNAEHLKQIFPEKEYRGPQSQFPHSCVCERIIYFHDESAFSAGGNMWTDPGTI